MNFVKRAVIAAAILIAGAASPVWAGEAEDRALGDPDAPVTIIEYASMSCSHCAAFHKNMLPWLKETYIETGKVRFVFRDFPLNGPAVWGAMTARCAKPDRYFAFLDMLFAKQKDWAFAEDPQAALAKLARVGGIGKNAFDKCMADQVLQDQIVQSRADAVERYNIRSTPSFIIDGKTVSGGLNEEKLTKLIEEAGS
jgi:protein-disulfide isomerase